MNIPHKNNHKHAISTFLQDEGLSGDRGEVSIEPLAGDGSSRLFFRIENGADGSFCGVLPGRENSENGLAEAHAAYNIGRHLRKRGIPVPVIHLFQPESGFILFEDLGDTLLHDELQHKISSAGDSAWDDLKKTYREIVEQLLYMQISGSVRFDRKWCWDTQRYDKKLMLAKESGYFLQSFCRDLLGIERFTSGLDREFKKLAGRAARQPAVYFLHRDFQSRNIMLVDGAIKFIDFQGGRLGPLGYDLASLLIDPYALIPQDVQQELLEHYLEHLCKYGLDDQAFLKGYGSLALQRNLQILGAFAFLSKQKGKTFFARYIPPALQSLQQLLAAPGGEEYPHLQRLTENILILMDKNGKHPSAAQGNSPENQAETR